jgi:hypothetical protein
MYQELLDFLQRSYFVIIYAITLAISIVTYKKYFDTALRHLPLLITYTLLNELLGYFIRYYPEYSFFPNLGDSFVNEIIYNLYDLVFFPYFYYVYWKLIHHRSYKNWVSGLSIIAITSFFVSCIFQNPMHTSLYYANAIASWVLLACIILYFKDWLKRNETAQPKFKYNLVFWISSGLFIFHLFAPIFFLIGYLSYDVWVDYDLKIFLHVLIVIMYSLFCVGFILNRKKAFG